MSRRARAAGNWERLVVAALDCEEKGHVSSSRTGEEDFPAFVPYSLGQDSNIESFIDAATEIQDEDPRIARIICEHAYIMAHNLDPNSVGRGVLQFKTGLISTMNQKKGKKEGESLDKSQDYKLVKDFYISYKKEHNIKELEKKHEYWKKNGPPDDRNAKERSILLKKGYNVLRVLKDVWETLEHQYGHSEAEGDTELKKTMELDAAKIEDFGTYNILPLDAPGISDVILSQREVKAAMAAMECNNELPSMPEDFHLQYQRQIDIFDVLEYIFVFQKDNIKNQREHLVLLLANAQSRMLDGISDQNLQLDQSAIEQVVDKKVLANYYQWCQYLQKKPVCDEKSTSKKLKLILVALYLLIWGEAGNVRFLPEGLCYLFHQMATEFLTIVQGHVVYRAKSYKSVNGSFLSEIIQPFYDAILKEVKNNKGGKSPHSAWRNYDDFNEFFWGTSCFELGWPLQLDAAFFSKQNESRTGLGKQVSIGKTNFVEHRSFLHLYHSFHRFWIFFTLMFQGLIIIAFSKGHITTTLRNLLSLGPTYLTMKFLESVLDVMFMYGAYKNSKTLAIARIFIRFMLFGGLSAFVTYLYIILLQKNDAVNSSLFHVFLWALGIYIIFHLLVSLVMHIPAFRGLSNKCDNWRVLRFFKWINEEHYYVGRGLYENASDYMKYALFWIVVLSCKFTFSYFVMIRPLVPATRTIIGAKNIAYEWHDLVSKNNHNALTVAAIWSPVAMIYFLDISVWYTVFSAIVGGLIGAKQRLGEIHSLEVLRKRFQKFPDAVVRCLKYTGTNRRIRSDFQEQQNINISKDQSNAARFALYWNEIIKYLREEDFINNKERYLLEMPLNKENFSMVQWPLFLLASKIYVAIGLAVEIKDGNEQDFWEKFKKDEFMCLAVQEAFYTVEAILTDLLHDEALIWAKNIFADAKLSHAAEKIFTDFQKKSFHSLVDKIIDLTKILSCDKTDDAVAKAVKALNALYDTVTHDVISSDLRKKYDAVKPIADARINSKLFSDPNWPGMDKRDRIKRLYRLLKRKKSATNVPINLEARRRLQFFTNSLFMDMPEAPLVRTMLSFCVFTPYYKEDVLYKEEALRKLNEDGISTLYYLQNIYPDEWSNFLERVDRDHKNFEGKEKLEEGLQKELRLWASYRGQTLARTVRGMMYYEKALMLQSMLEQDNFGDPEENQEGIIEISKERNKDLARAQAGLKFTYVVTCQIYGKQKQDNEPNATDILGLMNEYKALRVAFIDTVETLKDQKLNIEYYSKLVKAGENKKDQEIYSIKLPGNPILGEGKPENQNHAIIFTRGEAIQTIDMNQDNYFEETLKMRNLLQEFVDKRGHGLRPPTILGVREHVFTGSISSLAWFMSNQETSFVTLGQRVLATPLKVRMHYGHPDVFDRVFHITRGGISKSSKVINISEDIFAGFNSTLRMGNVTHHEYIQVGKGRDVGLNQIAIFEGKVAGGNGEQSLSRDVYRLGQLFDFFRMLSFFISSVGFYVCTMMTALTVYVFLYGKAYLVLSGVGQALENTADITDNISLDAALNTQFLLQIGIFTAVPMIMGFILEQGVLKALVSFVTMQLQLASVFFTFSLGTRTHYFGRTILHGGAKYQETGRGFVVTHIKFAENYRLYSRSHFVKAMEIAMLLIVYLSYKSEQSTTMSYILLSFSSWFLALSWLFAPFIFNPSGFEWQKIVSDFDDWTNWLLYKGGVGVDAVKSWESWWESEQKHIRYISGQILETILSLRFFIFQYGVVYQLDVTGKSTSIKIYGFSWLVLLGILLLFKVFTLSQKAYVHLQMILRFVQGTLFVLIIGGLSVLVAKTGLTFGDIFASALALIPTGWGLLSIAIVWKSAMKRLQLWNLVQSIARLYDAMIGIIIFVPIAALSWFPFFSVFQSRLLFNQAFSRGLEISIILEGSKLNKQS